MNNFFTESIDKGLKESKIWKNLFFGPNEPSDDSYLTEKEQMKDLVSYYFINLALSKNGAFKNQLKMVESEFFNYRYQIQDLVTRQQFLKDNNLDFKPISADEKNSVIDLLPAALSESRLTIETSEIFCVPFVEALDLIRMHRCLLLNGNAYVANRDVIKLATLKFRQNYSRIQ